MAGIDISSVVEGNFISNIVHNYGCIYLDFSHEHLTVTHNVCQDTPLWMPVFMYDGKIKGNDILVQDTYTNVPKAINLDTPLYLTETTTYNDEERNIHILETHIVPNANWPPKALEIIANAGLQEEYLYLLKYLEP